MITEDYVSFETAKLLKEKGFDEPCALTEFDCDAYKKWVETAPRPITLDVESEKPFRYSVPSIYVAMKWLREVHGLFIGIVFQPECLSKENKWFWKWNISDKGNKFALVEFGESDTYEEACEAAIKHCLENLI